MMGGADHHLAISFPTLCFMFDPSVETLSTLLVTCRA